MKKGLFLILLCLCLGALMPAMTSARAEKYTDEDGVAWLYLPNADGKTCTVTQCSQKSGSITVPSEMNNLTVTGITGLGGFNLFSYGDGSPEQATVTSVVLPDTITTIGDYTFLNCRDLTSINLPDNISSIGFYAFQSCTSLEIASLPDKLKSIGNCAFYGCSNITLTSLPDEITYIGDYAFYGCSKLALTSLPDSVSSINDSAFSNCTKLALTSLPDSVSSIGNYAFLNCTDLQTITIPVWITQLNNHVFGGCEKLTSVYFKGNPPALGAYAFTNTSSSLTFYFPRTATGWTTPTYTSGEVTYKTEPYDLYTVTFDSNGGSPIDSQYIISGGRATLPKAPTRTAFTFGGWYSDEAFDTAWDFEDIVNGDVTLYAKWTPVSTVSGIWTYIPDQEGITCTITRCSPTSAAVAIPSAIDGYTVAAIGDSAFDNCTSLTSISIPGSVTSIGENAFYLCYKLTSITIPNSVTSIGDSAFIYCSGLTSVTLSSSLTSIGKSVFSGCSGLTSITIPDSVTSIGENAFSNCSKLDSITIPDSVTSIGDFTFYYCSGLTSMTIPESVTSIGRESFSYCSGLTSITIPDSVTSIGENAFYFCSNLRTVTISASITAISAHTFSECPNLSSAYFRGNAPFIEYSAFGSNPLETVTLYYLSTSSGWRSPVYSSNGNVFRTALWQYTVTFNSDGGIEVPSQPVDPGNKATMPTPTRTGHSFVGWYIDELFTELWDFNNPVNTNITLYAKWNIESYTVTFETDGGRTVASQTVRYGDRIEEPPIPAKTDYVFAGWYPDDEFSGEEWDFDNYTMPAGDLTLYAKWEEITYSVSLSESGTYTFPGSFTGYEALSPLTVSVSNIGNQPTGALTVSFSGADADSFSLSVAEMESIAVAGARSFTVVPKTGLAVGTYTATISVSGGNGISASFNLSFAVSASSGGGIEDSGGSSGGTPSGDASTPSGTSNKASVVTADGKVETIQVTTSGDSVSAELTEDHTQLLNEGKSVAISLPQVEGVTEYALNLPATGLTGDGSGAISVTTDVGSVSLPSDMLTGTGMVPSGTATFTIARVEPDKLPESALKEVGNRPVISLSLSIDGERVNWNNPDGPVTVSIPYTPTAEELLNPQSIVVWYIDGGGNLTCVTSGRYNPDTGTVSFTTTHFSHYAVGYNAVRFTDVSDTAWYYDAVTYIAARKITSGTSETTFSPDATLTRGQFITLLMRAYGIEEDKAPADNFTDAGNTYYTGYLAAAKRLGISSGVGENRFAPEQAITRQEMFTLLHNALRVIKRLPQGDSGRTLESFADSEQIDAWAREAMAFLVKAGVVSGSGGNLNPTGTATRAEMAQLLYNLLSQTSAARM